MANSPFPIEQYLDHLGLRLPISPTAENLIALHRAHCFRIPFENLDPYLGRGVSLDQEHLIQKILHEKRGGYCFELNGCFLSLLQGLGYIAEAKLGRVFMGRPSAGGRTHQVSLVQIQGRTWLADVGFGGAGLVDPIPFEAGFEGLQHWRKIRLRRDPLWGIVYQDEWEGSWRTIYAIPDEHTEEVDRQVGNHYCATHPESTFRKSLFCAFPTSNGRISLWNRSVHYFQGAERSEGWLNSVEELNAFFQKLGLRLSQEDLEGLQARLP